MKEKYNLKYIDIKNNVLSGNKKWIADFCERYPKEVGLPFRVMVQPLQLQKEYAFQLKKPVIGLNSWNISGLSNVNNPGQVMDFIKENT